MNKGIMLFICISSTFKILTPFSIIGSTGHIKWRYRVVADNAIHYSVYCKKWQRKTWSFWNCCGELWIFRIEMNSRIDWQNSLPTYDRRLIIHECIRHVIRQVMKGYYKRNSYYVLIECDRIILSNILIISNKLV